MSYQDVIKAGDLRQGDHVYTGRGEKRRVLATFWKPGYSFIRVLIAGDNEPRELSTGWACYVQREPV